LGLLALVLAALVWWLDPLSWLTDPGLAQALVQRGRVAVYGDERLASMTAEGSTLVAAAAAPGVLAALEGGDAERLRAAMREAEVDALLLDAASPAAEDSLAGRFGRYASVPGFRGLHLAPTAALYAPDPTAALSEAHRKALARVARGLLRGARPPRITSFPEPLRRLQPVEVMVLVRQGPRPRLWRSARGNSIARALNTAAVVARKRWFEREQAMGGPIDELLPRMRVEVALLADDGTIGATEPAFIDRVFTPEHGVAYERKGAWRYQLPAATREAGQGRASVAYRQLFSDDGLPPDSFGAPEVRLYRLLVDTLAVSEPPPPPKDGLSPVADPNEVIEHGPEPAAPQPSEARTARPRRERRPPEEPDDGLSAVADPAEVLGATPAAAQP
jgi:hypothetical protein